MRRLAPIPVSRRRGVAPDAVLTERNLPCRSVKLPVSALPITFSIRACHLYRRNCAVKRPLRWRLTTRLPMRLKHEAKSGKLTVRLDPGSVAVPDPAEPGVPDTGRRRSRHYLGRDEYAGSGVLCSGTRRPIQEAVAR